ncbi:tRNA (adenosine(37)-N6)-threonylcarbamoyltransferase complex ATPase subunit type 1 TsaE [soil metagenome]
MTPSRLPDRTLVVPDPGAMRDLGREFGETAPDHAVLLIEGPLGAGKTTFAQGVGEGCGVAEPITSPTYNLILHYEGNRQFTHVDLFRLADSAALETLDLDEILSTDGVTCIEWPELIADRVRSSCARVRIRRSFSGTDARAVSIDWEGEGWGRLMNRLLPARRGTAAEEPRPP